MKKEITCTVCPRGCLIIAEGEKDIISSMTGFTCNRGKTYAEAEFSHPVRIITTTVKISGFKNELLPVRSDKPIPKEKIFECMDLIRKSEVNLPVSCNDIIIPDIAGTGADIIATKSVE